MDLPADALRHLEHDLVAWLTTTTSTGAPSPTPVWFIRDGDAIVTFCEPASRKAANLRANPRATLHFNSDPHGQDIVVIHATAVVEDGHPPSAQPGYLDRYAASLDGWGTTGAELDTISDTRITLTPRRVWLGPG